MTKLFITLSDGSYHYGTLSIYKPGSDTPSWTCTSKKTFLSLSDRAAFIGLQDGSIYNISAVVKIIDMTSEEYISYIRDTKLTKILDNEFTR
jgi:hypothetical protein